MPKRECKDVFINNYNPRILQDDPSNHDIQIIAGEEGAYACAVYAAKYLSKDEEGQSKLLRTIEQESLKLGDSTEKKLQKLGQVLEDTREISMQEVIFRLFGYAMCKSSRKNKFIQTQAPEKRDGLLKGNIDQLGDDDEVFCYNIIDYYQERPGSLENLTLGSFAADYEYYKNKTKNTKQTKNTNTEDGNLQEGDKSQDDNQEEGDNSQADNSQDDKVEEHDNSQDDKSQVDNSQVDNLEEYDNCQDDKEEHKGEDDNIEEDDNNDEHDNMEKKKIYLLNNMGYLKKGKRVQL